MLCSEWVSIKRVLPLQSQILIVAIKLSQNTQLVLDRPNGLYMLDVAEYFSRPIA